MGLIICSVTAAIVYLLIRSAIGPPQTPPTPDYPRDTTVGAMLVFAGFGGAAGWLWGAGSFSSGAAAHEGPVVHYLEGSTKEKGPNLLSMGRVETLKFLKWAIPLVRPLIKPLGIALGIALIIFAVILLIGANPIVKLATLSTYNADASAAVITGNKVGAFILYAIFFVIGPLVTTALGLALIMVSLSRQVEVAKKMKVSRLPSESPVLRLGHYLLRLGEFFVAWLNDVLAGIQNWVSR